MITLLVEADWRNVEGRPEGGSGVV